MDMSAPLRKSLRTIQYFQTVHGSTTIQIQQAQILLLGLYLAIAKVVLMLA